jgi:hypothetical protein
MTGKTDKHPCSMCGGEHGDCFICESICYADESVERALFVGFSAGLGAQLRTRKSIPDVVQFMVEKLCEEHRKLWSELSIRTVARVKAGRS